jgi:hypothetical protein
MRAVQYFGRKVIEDASILNERGDRLKLLYPLVDIITDLDPRHTSAYRFGGFFVHDYVDQVKGFTLLEKAIQNNPDTWQLYQDLAFLYWVDGRCQEASDTYARGAKTPSAPVWMAQLSATVYADCGDSDTARAMYTHMLEEATDPRVVADLERKLREVQVIEEVDLLEEAVAAFKQRTGKLPDSLAQVRPFVPAGPGKPRLRFDARGQPLDPNGVPYLWHPHRETVTTDPTSMMMPWRIVRRPVAGGR